VKQADENRKDLDEQVKALEEVFSSEKYNLEKIISELTLKLESNETNRIS